MFSLYLCNVINQTNKQLKQTNIMKAIIIIISILINKSNRDILSNVIGSDSFYSELSIILGEKNLSITQANKLMNILDLINR